ncbi:Hypothetical predicted protein [Olea europaea subsp. europaea]|uniref:Uncharacterized protein n=1 Tax=Olea europaea subsp. europaea TaxID=158383 RepID=A0A8S0TQI9_OLEEU|nr:Hypothetical predicted protein [Olea europaea subsp. europaea]
MEESNHQELITSSSSSSSSFESEMEDLRRLENAPPFLKNPKAKRLSKQLSMLETPRDIAVNRNLSMSPVLSPNSTESAPALGGRSTSFESDSSDSWKICSPGDDPQHVKTKLRHWAQAVACSVRQSS